MTLQTQIASYQTRVNNALEAYLPAATVTPERLHQAMRYAVLNGGKRIRPLLVYATGEALQIPADHLDVIACAVEFIHAYSLIHDDLPVMDDDALRRGLPTCHIAFDEATAVLAGDALQTLAFATLAEHQHPVIPAERSISMLSVLAKAAGSQGMVGGQALDLAATGQQITLAELELMHSLKTGALIIASVQLAALAAPQLASHQYEHLLQYAQCLGLAFQIQDDILDVESTTDVLGKQQGADSAQHKITYPRLLGLADAKTKANALVNTALAHLTEFGASAALLSYLAEFMVRRSY